VAATLKRPAMKKDPGDDSTGKTVETVAIGLIAVVVTVLFTVPVW